MHICCKPCRLTALNMFTQFQCQNANSVDSIKMSFNLDRRRRNHCISVRFRPQGPAAAVRSVVITIKQVRGSVESDALLALLL